MKYLVAIVFIGFAFTGAAAHGHGGQHGKDKTSDAASAEQKEFGKAGDPKKSTRTIRLTMDDNMRFTPNAITVRQGESVSFIVANKGKILHEMVIGTMQELQQHAAMMKKFPGMKHDEPHMAHVGPGRSESLAWTFNRPGEFNFACLVAGHFESGMTGTISVAGMDSRTPRH